MLLMGDEMGRTQGGNNNAYCHDDETSWPRLGPKRKNSDLFTFFKHCVAFRKAHRLLRDHHSLHRAPGYNGAWVTWGGVRAGYADWSSHCRTLAFMPLTGGIPRGAGDRPVHLHRDEHALARPQVRAA